MNCPGNLVFSPLDPNSWADALGTDQRNLSEYGPDRTSSVPQIPRGRDPRVEIQVGRRVKGPTRGVRQEDVDPPLDGTVVVVVQDTKQKETFE